MPFLVAEDLPQTPPGARLRALLKRGECLGIPGAHNALAGLMARRAGFQALYLSGAAMSASMGLPDLGIITVDDVCFFIRTVSRATGLPVLVDGDTGYGEALNVMAMVRAFEAAGAAAVHIEDQILPKKCGHLNDKKLAGRDEMAAKVNAARRARRDLYIIARTDAVANEGMQAAIDRARAYIAAGADAIFPEALTTEQMFREFRAAIDVPLLANMTEFGRTPFFTREQFAALGYEMVIWPVSSLRIEAHAVGELYATLAEAGSTERLLPRMQTRAELYATIRLAEYEALDSSIVTTVLPHHG
jgi:methylisocitrate lyase